MNISKKKLKYRTEVVGLLENKKAPLQTKIIFLNISYTNFETSFLISI